MSGLKLIAIETSSATGSVALGIGAGIIERTIATAREQTESVLGHVDGLLAAAGIGLGDVDALLFGRGPGSFTGIRVAAAVVQGLSLATDLPIVPVSSLAALAERGLSDSDGGGKSEPAIDHAVCCLDARMGEVYRATFARTGGRIDVVVPETVGSAADVTAPEAPFLALGDGFTAFATELGDVIGRAARLDAEAGPRARDLIALGTADVEAKRFVALADALPVYLRGADAWKRSQ